jgi:hypothetical protein
VRRDVSFGIGKEVVARRMDRDDSSLWDSVPEPREQRRPGRRAGGWFGRVQKKNGHARPGEGGVLRVDG